MSFVTRKHLPRRTFLRGAGVTLALPLLESMVPALTALAQTAAAPRLRLGFAFMPHGAVMANWTPVAEGALQLSPILAAAIWSIVMPARMSAPSVRLGWTPFRNTAGHRV